MKHAGRWMVLAFVFALPALGQSLGERIVAKADALEKKVKCVVGVSVVELGGGKRVAAYREEELFAPASNMKVVTSMVAMRRLGVEHSFKTTVLLVNQEVKNGKEVKIVKDVVVVGGFDPLLGDPVVASDDKRTIYDDLDIWAGALKQAADGEVNDVIVLTHGSPKTYRHADWPANQFGRWYSAPVAAVNFNNNCLDVTFRATEAGLTPLLSPDSRHFTVNNRLKAGSATWNLTFSAGDATVTLTGVAKASNTPQSVAVNDPPMLLARVLADRLARTGATVGGAPRTSSPADAPLDQARPIAQTASPMDLVLKRCNKRSLNMAAECLLLAAGDGTWEGSARLAGQTLVDDLGLDARQFTIADGSGDSKHNRITPAAMTTLLIQALSMKGADAFLSSLPVSGEDGSLAKRLTGAGAKGRVLGKTGYIAGVSCLSGYVLDADGKPAYAYSILVNKNVDLTAARTLQDEICAMLVHAATGDK